MYRIIVSIIFTLLLIAAAYYVRPVQADNIATRIQISVCGDGVVSAGELCDSGAANNLGTYGSSTAERVCAADCVSWGPYCGDAILQARFTEQCDDGNSNELDLCTSQCVALTPVPASDPGAPPRGSTADVPGGIPGAIPADIQTKVVLRGKAYPLSKVTILLDGKIKDTVNADVQADFVYSTSEVTPGTATFAVRATDAQGIDSTVHAVVFEVVQSAVTTVSNIFLPPTITLSSKQVAVGDSLTISGQTVPNADVKTELAAGAKSTLEAESDGGGKWVIQVDTKSLKQGPHTAKSLFELSADVKSGFGRSISFLVGQGSPALGDVTADINRDGKVNLVDFSIFLLSWGSDDIESDFNLDGNVNLADFSIMLFNWTG